MTDRVLTDAEIAELETVESEAWSRTFARAVEAAVLAKCVRLVDTGVYAYYSPRNCVAEREARRREREAWQAAVRFLYPRTDAPNGPHYWTGEAGSARVVDKFCVDGERDRLYPLPKITRPRRVMLSGEREVSTLPASGWMLRQCGRDDVHYAGYAPWGWANTPADARLLADLVENPTEEVEE